MRTVDYSKPDDDLYMQFITSSCTKWDTSSHKLVNQPKVCVGRLDEYGEVVDCVYPPAGQNLTAETRKLVLLYRRRKTRLMYSTMPLVIKTPGESDTTIDSSSLKK